MSKKTRLHRAKSKPQIKPIDAAEIKLILAKIQTSLSVQEYDKLNSTIMMTIFLQEEIKRRNASIKRLRDLIYGAPTEKTNKVLGQKQASAKNEKITAEQDASGSEYTENKEKLPGHGRNGAAAYTGAEKIYTPHTCLSGGDDCPECSKGKVYTMPEPQTLVRITGVAPLFATVYSNERLRCNLCGEVFTASAPEGVGEDKYDEGATAMIAELKYGAGLPFNRIEKLQEGMGIPLPATTQWELVRDGADLLEPVYDELINQAAQGKVLHNDDTTMKVLELTGEQRAVAAADEETNERTGVFTSGIVAIDKKHRVALFFTGANHAGENLAEVLARRAAHLPKPIQMCDSLNTNTAHNFEAIVANCIAHARRRYVDVINDFPDECRFVLETLRDVYKNDALAQQQNLSATARLIFHKTHSKPLMLKLEEWMQEKFDQLQVEPNSGLGVAIKYMQRHWSKLTLFLRKAGAPLDNNVCERALKKTILHRKNALFYKTLKGAHVGDVFMSFIHTAELNKVKPFDYLLSLLRNAHHVEKSPGDWMPWNYTEALAKLPAGLSTS